MKKHIIYIVTVISLAAPISVRADVLDDIKAVVANHPLVATVVGIAAGSFIVKKAYDWVGSYFENKLNEAIVDNIIVGLTLNSTLEKLPAAEKEKKLRQKAWLIDLRKRVMSELADLIKKGDLSPAHQANLQSKLDMATVAFKAIDFLRETNPYEKEYVEASFVDHHIQNSIIKSILLRFKPDSECTQVEMAQKAESARSGKILASKLQDRITASPAENMSGLVKHIIAWL